VIVHAITLGIAAAVDQFTAEREADLRASRDALLQARGYERQLIGIVSHDLRNPLGIIMACVDVAMRRQELPSGATTALRRLRSSAERAVRLIGDLLDFTQERLLGHIPVRPEASDMEALLCAAVEEAALTHSERTIERAGATGPVEGRWDRDRIAQVLANLLDNALKFSPADSAVRVETRADGQRVAIAVHNWGPPIPPERLGSVFDVFERADPGASARVSLGLGLHICQQIAQAHGGNLEVRSSVEQGTTFTVTLPRMCSSNGGNVEAVAPARPVDRAFDHQS
jgi:signal transduction histidine kinase